MSTARLYGLVAHTLCREGGEPGDEEGRGKRKKGKENGETIRTKTNEKVGLMEGKSKNGGM